MKDLSSDAALAGASTVMVVPRSASVTGAPPLLVTGSSAPPAARPSVTWRARLAVPESAGSASESVGRRPAVMAGGVTTRVADASTGVPMTGSVQWPPAPPTHCGYVDGQLLSSLQGMAPLSLALQAAVSATTAARTALR